MTTGNELIKNRVLVEYVVLIIDSLKETLAGKTTLTTCLKEWHLANMRYLKVQQR